MILRKPGLALIAIVSIFISACSTKTTISNPNSDYAAKTPDCDIEFFKDENPEKSHETLTQIESHIKKNLFLGGVVQLEDEAYDELRSKACGLGGDAVIINDSIETSVSEMSHVHVWATVIKYN